MPNADLSRVSSALATLFQSRIVAQMNRSVVLLQLLPTAPAIGQNLQWDTEFKNSGEATDSTIADGADVSVYQDDDLVPATLQFATYSEAFAVTGKARAAARASRSPDELADLFSEKIERAVRRLTKNIAKDIYTGNGASNKMAGLIGASAILSTGTYANIARATYADWAGTELANGAVPRALTFQLMRDMRRSIYNACGEQPDLIVCDAAQHEKFGQLFDGQRRYNQDVFLRGNKITLSGGYKALEFDGIPVIADVNCPSGKMLFLNSNYVKLRQLPDEADGVNQSAGMLQLHGTAEEQLGSGATSLMARINPLARTGDAYKFQLVLYPQLQVERPNANGVISDLN
jgi:hypothetical protein